MDVLKCLLIVLLLCGSAWGEERPRAGGGPGAERDRSRTAPPREEVPRDERPRGEGFRGEGFRGEGFRDEGFRGEGSREGWRPGRFREEPTEEEWSEAAAFMQAHSPNRWQYFNAMEEDDRFRGRLHRRIVHQYQLLEAIEDRDLQQLKIQQIEVEDEVFGLVQSLRAEDPAPELAAPEPIAEKIRDLVEMQFAERRFHIERLETALEDEKARLARDESNLDKLVEEQWKKWARLWGPREPEFRDRWRQRGEEREGRRDAD